MKLNLGCGFDIKEGYVNVDIDLHKGVDTLWDLETFPWPWEDDSVEEIRLHHILEHLGSTTDIYYRIWKEIYRICKNDAQIHIIVPHPRHADFLGDPSHVRAITVDGLHLLSKRNCKHWHEINAANTKLAEYLNVDFEITKVDMALETRWLNLWNEKKINEEDLEFAITHYNNVIKQWAIVMKTIKDK